METTEFKINKVVIWTIGIILGVLVISYLVYGIFLVIWTGNICEAECEAMGALHYDRIKNGELNTDDLYICYFEDGIKAYRLGKRSLGWKS